VIGHLSEDRRTGGQEDRRTGGQEDRRTGGQEDRTGDTDYRTQVRSRDSLTTRNRLLKD